jgi:hypothetical protein
MAQSKPKRVNLEVGEIQNELLSSNHKITQEALGIGMKLKISS